MKLVSTNPAKNYMPVGEVICSTKEDVEHAVKTAHESLKLWRGQTIEQRIDDLKLFVDAAKAKSEDFARIISLETGRPIFSSRADVAKGISCFEEYFATAAKYLAPMVTLETNTEIHTVIREPWGVVAAICPWNFPFTNIAWQCGQALLSGNTIVYKNSELNPLFAKLLEETIKDAKLPDGVFNVVYGDGQVGEWLANSGVDRISFTGSFNAGHKLTKIAADKFIPITTELGGSNPYIIFPDAKLDDADIENIYSRRFLHSGQFCTSVKRLIVHKSRYEELVDKLVTYTKSKKIGDPLDEDTDLGSLVSEQQLIKLEAQVKDATEKGAKILLGGKRPDKLQGAFYEPTILTEIKSNMRVWHEETFGPVLPIVTFDSTEEAINLANDTEYGLSAYLMTEDGDLFNQVADRIDAGMVGQKNILNLVAGHNPFGGYKHSGMGRENGEFGFHDATQVKLISRFK